MSTKMRIVVCGALLTGILAAGEAVATTFTADDASSYGGTGGGNSAIFSFNANGGATTARTNLGTGCVNHSAFGVNHAGATETWAIGAVSSFAADTYYVYGDWDMATGSPSTQFHYSAANVTSVYVPVALGSNLNPSLSAGQGAAGTISPPVNEMGSGYYYIGTFTLAANSAFTATQDCTTRYFCGDSIHIRKAGVGGDGFLLDPRGQYVTTTLPGSVNPQIGDFAVNPGLPPALGYTKFPGAGDINYHIGLADVDANNGAAGKADVQLSWAAVTGNPSETFVVDLDGNPTTTGDQTSFTISMAKLNDCTTTPSSVTWSGFYDLGSFTLTSASTMTASWGGGPVYLADALVTPMAAPSPEPATLVLLATGALGAFGYVRRQRMR